jgi:hypothetical protein
VKIAYNYRGGIQVSQVLHIHTKVLPGNRVEISAPELAVGQTVEVTVSPSAGGSIEHAIDILDSLPAQRLFKTPQEADEYLQRERDSWEK